MECLSEQDQMMHPADFLILEQTESSCSTLMSKYLTESHQLHSLLVEDYYLLDMMTLTVTFGMSLKVTAFHQKC